MGKSSKKFHKINRRIHLYSGLFMIPFIFIFGLSAISFNHPTFLSSNRSVDYFNIESEENFQQLFPNLEKLTKEIADSLQSQEVLTDFDVKNFGYNNSMILRNRNAEVDYRFKVDIPSKNVQLMSLPDFAENTLVKSGQFKTSYKLEEEKLLSVLEEVLKEKGYNPGTSRVQRIPYLQIDLTENQSNYRLLYDLKTGNYRINNLDKRTFKLNYLVGNLHELHGYPLSGFSLKWLWILFADALALLMIIWSVTGLIMWFKMKRQFVIGLIILGVSLLLFIAIVVNQYELGY